jgi:LSD1 subclass zinc finger protein
MTPLARAKRRMAQRSKLPSGANIAAIRCSLCKTPILCWDSDPRVTGRYPYEVKCTYCVAAERAKNAAIFGR